MIFLMLMILAGMLTYLATGYVAAWKATPALSSRCRYSFDRYEYPTLKEGPIYKSNPHGAILRQNELRNKQLQVLWLWPVAIPATLVSSGLESRRNQFDPEVAKQQAARIKELEEEKDQFEKELEAYSNG